MLVEPSVVYHRSAQRRCLKIARAIVAEIRVEPETPVDTARMMMAYKAVLTEDGAQLVNPVEYWIYQEFGTHNMPANRHVRPAIEKIRVEGVP